MRDHDFRAWDKIEKEYTYFSIDDMFSDRYSLFVLSERENFIIEQYSGLKDKNGLLVFEGDILTWDFITYTIEFRNGLFIDTDGILLCEFNDDSEIIGNIHENKDLIERI